MTRGLGLAAPSSPQAAIFIFQSVRFFINLENCFGKSSVWMRKQPGRPHCNLLQNFFRENLFCY
jgi:hypothetical protein